MGVIVSLESPEIGIFNRKGTRRAQRENGFTAENAEIAEKKAVPDSDQQGLSFLCVLRDLCGKFFNLRILRVLCG